MIGASIEALHPADIRCEASADGGTVELIIYGDIGASWWDDEGITAKAVQKALAQFPNATLIKVRVNSPGGNVFDGLAIYNILHNHSARVETHNDGMALSAASIVMMAGDEIWMAENAIMMIHEPWTCMCGSADDMRAEAAVLDKIAEQLVTTYAARSGLSTERVAELVKAETWMDADEAKELGFCTGVTAAKQAAAALRTDIRWPNAPEDKLRRAVALARFAGPTDSPPMVIVAEKTRPAPAPAEETKDENTMTTALAAIATALGLPPGASESDILTRASVMRENETQIMTISGVEVSGRCVGAVRALKETADKVPLLETELGQVRAERDKQNFAALLAKGQNTPVKLSPATAKLYQERFDAAVEKGTGASVVDDLEGFLAVAPTIMGAPKKPSGGEGASGAPAATGLTWNGKTYAELPYRQRARLSQENPELYRLMKDAHDQRAARSPRR